MAAVAAASARGRRLRYVTERRGFLASFLISPAVLFILLLVGAPLVIAVYLSFTDATAGSLSGNWVGLHNFRTQLSSQLFRDALWHTFLFTVISQLVVLVGAGLLAHALVRKFRGKWLLRALVLLPWAAPVALTTTGFLWFFDPLASIWNWFLINLHIVGEANKPNWIGTHNDAMASVIAVHAWRILPFATVIFIAGIASIPSEVDDAAAIDGATGLKKFWYVSLPLQLPIAIVATLFGIVFTATDMAVVYILTNGNAGTDVITTWAFKTGIESGSLGAGAAVSLFMLPVLAVVAIGMLYFARRTEVT
ncbi:MAG TPA: sugar ABC transporter permease [Gaiellaceae bacterium]|jgi:multiple sugar transport system permease protein